MLNVPLNSIINIIELSVYKNYMKHVIFHVHYLEERDTKTRFFYYQFKNQPLL